MKYFDLDKEEKQLLEDFEKGELVSIGKNKKSNIKHMLQQP